MRRGDPNFHLHHRLLAPGDTYAAELDTIIDSAIFSPLLGYEPDAVSADGNQKVRLTTTAGDFVDSNDFTLSCWLKPNQAGYSSNGSIVQSVNSRFNFFSPTGDLSLRVQAKGVSGPSNVVELRSAASVLTDGVWNHVFIVCDGSEAAPFSCYVNGTEVGYTTNTSDQTNAIDFSVAEYAIFDDDGAAITTVVWAGCIADLYLECGTIRALADFYAAAGPVDYIGNAVGSPHLALKGPVADFGDNLGSVSLTDAVVNGPLTACSTNPG